MKPRTYVFGFRGFGNASALRESVNEWLQDNRFPGSASSLLLPRVIVAGKAVMVSYGDPLRLSGMTLDEGGDIVFQTGLKVGVLIDTDTRFGWLASHLLYVVDEWFQQWAHPLAVRRSVARYIPFNQYFQEKHGNASIYVCYPQGAVIRVDDFRKPLNAFMRPEDL